jgi:hypothetical protein
LTHTRMSGLLTCMILARFSDSLTLHIHMQVKLMVLIHEDLFPAS